MKNNAEKAKWMGLLFLALGLFILALLTHNSFLNLIVIGLSVYIYKYGNPILFKEYDAKRQAQYQQYQMVQKAASEATRSGSLFRSKKDRNGDV